MAFKKTIEVVVYQFTIKKVGKVAVKPCKLLTTSACQDISCRLEK